MISARRQRWRAPSAPWYAGAVRGLRGRAVVVTGAASGIGRATCVRLAAEGALVALVDRERARSRSSPT
jgi:NADPH:quinone reductase-like Zn-dependent oxidoreductase